MMKASVILPVQLSSPWPHFPATMRAHAFGAPCWGLFLTPYLIRNAVTLATVCLLDVIVIFKAAAGPTA
jgi:hypothetical protein